MNLAERSITKGQGKNSIHKNQIVIEADTIRAITTEPNPDAKQTVQEQAERSIASQLKYDYHRQLETRSRGKRLLGLSFFQDPYLHAQ